MFYAKPIQIYSNLIPAECYLFKVLVTTIDTPRTLLNTIITAQWEGMGDAGSARYEPALLPPCPTIRILSYSNCQRSTHSISK